MAPLLQADTLRLGYDGRIVVDDISLTIPPGEVTAIVGPNACGKSTLLRALARLLRPTGGAVLLDDSRIDQLPTKSVAQKLGILPQTPVAPNGIRVVDLVARGRTPHQRRFAQWSPADETAVQRALDATGTAPLADRTLDELSGGQRQRVWIAMALAQETEILLLDEPTTFLDIPRQLEVLELVRSLNEREGRTIVLVLHDLNLAARYASNVIAMRDGRIIAEGSPTTVVTEAHVHEVFDLRARVIDDPISGTPLVIPIGPSTFEAS